jgi:hypothetical protein
MATGPIAAKRRGQMANIPFREAYERSGLSLSEVARRMGWMRSVSRRPQDRVGDSSRVGRVLGLRRETPSTRNGGGAYRKYVRYSTAEALCRALDLDPLDVDL